MSLTRVGGSGGTVYVAPTVVAVVADPTSSPDTLVALTTAADVASVVDALDGVADAAIVHLDEPATVATIGRGCATVADVQGDTTVFHGRTGRWSHDRWETSTAAWVRVGVPDAATAAGGSPHSDLEGCDDDAAVWVGSGVVRGGWATRPVSAATTEPDPFDALFGDTVDRSLDDAAIRPADGRPPRASVLVGSDGRRIVVDRPVLIGRNPEPADDGERRARLVHVLAADVSRRHALVRPGTWTAIVDDLSSSNGTLVVRPDATTERVVPGRPHPLTAGSTLRVGSWSFACEVVA